MMPLKPGEVFAVRFGHRGRRIKLRREEVLSAFTKRVWNLNLEDHDVRVNRENVSPHYRLVPEDIIELIPNIIVCGSTYAECLECGARMGTPLADHSVLEEIFQTWHHLMHEEGPSRRS